jgi:hypothetical protein
MIEISLRRDAARTWPVRYVPSPSIEATSTNEVFRESLPIQGTTEWAHDRRDQAC